MVFQFSQLPAGAPCQELPPSTDDAPPAKPADAPAPRGRGGRGKKGSTAQVAAVFGVSKPTARNYIAAAQAEAAAKEGDTAAQRSESTTGTAITGAERQERAAAAAALAAECIAISDRAMLVDLLEQVSSKGAALFVKSLLARLRSIAQAA